MGKRKKSSNNTKEKKPTYKQASFWSNAGVVPVAAINPGRPFDFQTGIVNPHAPFEYGSIQYVVTELEVPDTWPKADCFKLTSAKLFQDIRENLRSNLKYEEYDLRLYLANVMFLQAMISIIQRDFAFKYFEDPQHPTFDKVWGRALATKIDSSSNPVRPSVSVETPTMKSYLQYGSYAENLTYFETVFVPACAGVILPPAMSEYLKWLFDGVFTDEIDVSRGQYYWNEIRHIPIFGLELDANNVPTGELKPVGFIDSASVTLESLTQFMVELSAKFGTIIADLKRCGAQMVLPDASVQNIHNPKMRYDEMYFMALENAYTEYPRIPGGKVMVQASREFFNVDIIPGMSDANIASALSLLGGLDVTRTGGMSIPVYPVSQYALVWLDSNTRLLTDPFFYSANGNVSLPAEQLSGLYALRYDSATGSYVARDSSGPIIPTTDLNTTDQYYIGDGYYSATLTHMRFPMGDISNLAAITFLGAFVDNTSRGIFINTAGATTTTSFITTPGGQGCRIRVTGVASNITLALVNNPSVSLDFKIGSTWLYNSSYSGATSSPVSIGVDLDILITPETQNIGFSTVPTGLYTIAFTVSAGTSSPGAVFANAYTNVFCPGTMRIGKQDNTVTAWNADPSVPLAEYLRGEIEHHIPQWRTNVMYDADAQAVQAATVSELLKKTRSTTVYSATELNAYLYQLYYSLMTIHAKGRVIDKKA